LIGKNSGREINFVPQKEIPHLRAPAIFKAWN